MGEKLGPGPLAKLRERRVAYVGKLSVLRAKQGRMVNNTK